MDTTIEQQVAMGEALVPHAQRLRIGRSNFCLLSDIKPKESTLQLVYDVLRICPFFKAFLVTADGYVTYLSESPWTLTDVNINKLYQPWRSFAAIINKCLTEKSSSYDSLRLSQAQILWGLYHKRNVDYAYLMWEDFVYQVEHKNHKKSNEMYYPRFKKVIIHHFMNSKAYKEYYAVVTRETTPKSKASVWKMRSSFDTSITPPNTVAGPRLTTSAKGKQAAKATKAKSLSALSENSTDDEGDDDEGKNGDDDEEDEGDDGKEGDGDDDDDDEDDDGDEGNDDDDDDQEVGRDDDKDDDEEDLGLNVGEEERHVEEEEEDKLYRDVNINQGKGIQATLEVEDSHAWNRFLRQHHKWMYSLLPSLRTLEANFSEFTQTNQFAGAVSAIPEIVQQYMDQRINEAVKVAVQIQFDRLCDEAQKENDEFLKTVDENIEGKEPESASAPSETATRSADRSTKGSRSRQASASEFAIAEEPVQTTFQMDEPSHLEFDTCADDQPIVQST
nr:hypothetical protein [Tanacetum cinerariifolium]